MSVWVFWIHNSFVWPLVYWSIHITKVLRKSCENATLLGSQSHVSCIKQHMSHQQSLFWASHKWQRERWDWFCFLRKIEWLGKRRGNIPDARWWNPRRNRRRSQITDATRLERNNKATPPRLCGAGKKWRCDIWVLHIAKVGYFFSPYWANMVWLIFSPLLFFFYHKLFIFHFLAILFSGPNLHNAVR